MKTPRFSWRARLEIPFREHIWPRLLWLATPILWIKRRVRPPRTNVDVLTGTVAGGTETLAVICGVHMQIRQHLCHLIFDGEPARRRLGKIKVFDGFRHPSNLEPEADLAIMPATEGQFAWLTDGSWFSLPAWVTGHIALPLEEKVLRQESIKSIYRLIRRHDYEYIVTRDEKLFREFYFKLHEPYIVKNFGDRACLDSFAEKRANSAIFDLILVRKKSVPDVYLSGLLVIYEPQAPRLWSVGVRDGDRDLVRQGVLSAMYLFAFEYFTQQGYRSLFMGASRPYLKDGVLNFKRRYSHRLTGCRWEGFGLKILRLTPAVERFLEQNPFIFRTGGRLQGAVFIRGPVELEHVQTIFHDFFHPGMERLIIWVLGGGAKDGFPVLPPELHSRVEFRRGQDLVGASLHLP
ncbi:MAG TPA: hypothetical protein VF607_02610 [Verrucomicrobiae bacterium]